MTNTTSYTPNTNKNSFLTESSSELLMFWGGDADYITAALAGDSNKYQAWFQRLKEFPQIIQISTINITNILNPNKFPYDSNIGLK